MNRGVIQGARFTAPAAIQLAANPADADGTLAKVEFFNGATLIGTATTAPYAFTWSNVAAGNYVLTAVATNDAGGATTSSPIALRVDSPPTVALTAPANNAVLAAPANVALNAAAADAVGTLTKVDFYQGGTLIGTATASPYTVNWNSVPAGTYTLTAVATNDAGMATTSSPVALRVDSPPTVSLTGPADKSVFPAAGNITLAATAADVVGAITKVDFYQGNALIGTATVAPYTFNWSGVPAGTYTLTAVATNDAAMVTTSAPVTVNVASARAAVYYIHTDHLNSPRAITNQQGTIVWRWDNTDPFGANVPDGDPSGLGRFEFNLRFPGQYFDKETGTHYNYFRDVYDPATGRYEQSDPIGLDGGLNTYAYVNGNPLSLVDLLGLYNVNELAAIIFNETQSLSGAGIVNAQTAIGYIAINREVPGQIDPGIAPSQISSRNLGAIKAGVPSAVTAYNRARQAAATALCTPDTTGGAKGFVLKGNPFKPKRYGIYPVLQQFGPFNNSFPTAGNPNIPQSQQLPATGVYINIFAQ